MNWRREMTPAEVLREAAALIKYGWTKGMLARDAKGLQCHPDDPKAVCWCAWGAIRKAGDGRHGAAYNRFIDFIEPVCLEKGLPKDIAAWNDYAVEDGEEAANTLKACADKLEKEGVTF